MEFECENNIVKTIVVNNGEYVIEINSYKYSDNINHEVEIFTKEKYDNGDYCSESLLLQNKTVDEIIVECVKCI